MYFFNNGDHVDVDAYPTCTLPTMIGRLPRTAIPGICGGKPTLLNSFSIPSHSTSSPIIFHAEPSRFSRSRARRPTKYPCLSSATVHSRPSSNGEDFCGSIQAWLVDV